MNLIPIEFLKSVNVAQRLEMKNTDDSLQFSYVKRQVESSLGKLHREPRNMP